jgi:DNA-binding beta-propeller fold protein YncE/glutamine cyclotransferase
MSSNAITLMRAARTRPPSPRTWLRFAWRSCAASAAVTAAVVVAAVAGCGTRPASGEPGQVAHRRPARAVLTATFRLPGAAFGLASGDGAVWLATGNGVLRIGQRTDQLSRVLSAPGASLTSIAFGAGSVWAKDGAEILRVDPATGQILARIKVVAPVMTGGALSFGDGALWTATFAHDRPGLVRIDPATNGVRVTALPCAKVFTLAAGVGGVWISQLCGPGFPVLRIDPATGRVTARFTGQHLFWHLAAGDGAVWASGGASVARIDPKTAQVTATVQLAARPARPGSQPVAHGSGLLAAGTGVVWVTRAGDAHHASVLRIDPRTGHLAGPGVKIGGEPLAAAASGTTVWVLTSNGLARIDLAACGHGRCARPAPRASPATTPAETAVISAGSIVLALGPGSVFAASGHDVFQISPQTLKVRLLTSVQGTAQALMYSAGSLWVATSRALYRVSPARRRVIAAIAVPATALAYGAGAIWALDYQFTGAIDRSTLTKVNTTDQPSATLRMTEPTSVAAGAGGVWVGTDIAPIVYRIDPVTVRVAAQVKVCGGRGGPQLAIAGGAVWAANAACGTVSRIDPRSDSVRATVTVCRALDIQCGGPIGLGLSAGGGYLWISYEGVAHDGFARVDPGSGHVTPGMRIPSGVGPIQAAKGSVWIVMGNGRVAKYRV